MATPPDPKDFGYGEYQTRLAPGWLQGTNGEKWQTALGDEKSIELDRVRQALVADVPGQAPADAIDLVGGDRMLPRYATSSGYTEDAATYAERLRTAWDSPSGWSFAGSHGSLLLALARAGFPTGKALGAVVIQRTKRYSYLTGTAPNFTVAFETHSGWNFDWRDTGYWNQFGIVFGADIPALVDGSQQARILNATVRAWKPGKARYMGAIVVVSGAIWGWPLGVTWGMAGRTWGGVARYITP